VIDLLLGGEGTGKNPARDTTDIEDNILESVSKMICRELEAAWRVLHLTFVFERRQRLVQVEKLLPRRKDSGSKLRDPGTGEPWYV